MTVPLLEGWHAVCILYLSVWFLVEQWKFCSGDIVGENLTKGSAMMELFKFVKRLRKVSQSSAEFV